MRGKDRSNKKIRGEQKRGRKKQKGKKKIEGKSRVDLGRISQDQRADYRNTDLRTEVKYKNAEIRDVCRR